MAAPFLRAHVYECASQGGARGVTRANLSNRAVQRASGLLAAPQQPVEVLGDLARPVVVYPPQGADHVTEAGQPSPDLGGVPRWGTPC